MRWRRASPPALSPRDVAAAGLCVGCGSCVAQAGSPDARMVLDRYGQLKPRGPRRWRAQRTAALARTCPFSPSARNETEIAAAEFPHAPQGDALLGPFEAAYVGHVAEGEYRAAGSSGGMVSWVAAELLRAGIVDAVAHVAAEPGGGDRLFRYRISRGEAELRGGAKSRYYPVELSDVVAEIRARPGRYAVVGIPCFIKAVRLLSAEDPVLRERIVCTLGLFCGHMKSARMVDSFAWQMGASGDAVEAVDYRLKDSARPANWYRAQLRLKDGDVRAEDWWNLADGDWGAGFFQNSACNACDDVVAETADVSFGDAWVEPYASDGRGTNVVIVRSPMVHGLLRAALADGRLALKAVDSAFVERTQAAGFRHRREGLAYRLTWPRRGLRPRKRVAPGGQGLTLRRKAVYRMRAGVSAWSHRVFFLARLVRWPGLYVGWARASLAVYQGLTWSRGRIGAWADRLEARFGGARGDQAGAAR